MCCRSEHSSILAWEIPCTEEPGGLQSMGLQRVGHKWSDSACFFHKHRGFDCSLCLQRLLNWSTKVTLTANLTQVSMQWVSLHQAALSPAHTLQQSHPWASLLLLSEFWLLKPRYRLPPCHQQSAQSWHLTSLATKLSPFPRSQYAEYLQIFYGRCLMSWGGGCIRHCTTFPLNSPH